MSIGKRIVELRKRMGLTQVQLAKKAGVSQPTVSSYESDPGAGYRAEILFKIAAALETTPEYLMRGTGEVRLGDLKSDQRELISTIDKLSESERALLLSVAKSMLKS